MRRPKSEEVKENLYIYTFIFYYLLVTTNNEKHKCYNIYLIQFLLNEELNTVYWRVQIQISDFGMFLGYRCWDAINILLQNNEVDPNFKRISKDLGCIRPMSNGII